MHLILRASLVIALVCAVLFKEFKLLRVGFAHAGLADDGAGSALMGLVGGDVIGLQAVGLLLVVAVLIPAAAAS
jgi:hypothetical protein